MSCSPISDCRRILRLIFARITWLKVIRPALSKYSVWKTRIQENEGRGLRFSNWHWTSSIVQLYKIWFTMAILQHQRYFYTLLTGFSSDPGLDGGWGGPTPNGTCHLRFPFLFWNPSVSWTKATKLNPTLLVKAVNTWVCSAFGNVFLSACLTEQQQHFWKMRLSHNFTSSGNLNGSHFEIII